MYERSAIVLERYFEKIFGFNHENNLRDNYKNYFNILDEMKKYQEIVTDEEKIIQKFEEIAKEVEKIQGKQTKLCEKNKKSEEQRNLLINNLDETPQNINNGLKKIENEIDINNQELKQLREKYVEQLAIFIERQKERKKYEKSRRVAETNHIKNAETISEQFELIRAEDEQKIRQFMEGSHEEINKEIVDLMIKNGKNEKIGFNKEVIEHAVNRRLNIAIKEAELYVGIYDKTKKLVEELKNDNIRLGKFEKILRDTSVKLSFLEAEKEYIFNFLDNERMTVINGPKVHKKLMTEACENFIADCQQIDNLYELIQRETQGKSTKKAYKELYDKTYLKQIDEKEKSFEKEVNNIKSKSVTVINSNYWRTETIKNIYNTFQEEVSQKFNKDLSELKIEEVEEQEEDVIIEEEPIKEEIKVKNNKPIEIILDEEDEENNEDDYDIDEEDDEDDYDDDDYDIDFDDEEDEDGEDEEDDDEDFDLDFGDDEEEDDEEEDNDEEDDDDDFDLDFGDDEDDEDEDYDDEEEEDDDDDFDLDFDDDEDEEDDDDNEDEEDEDYDIEDDDEDEDMEYPKALGNKNKNGKDKKKENKKENKKESRKENKKDEIEKQDETIEQKMRDMMNKNKRKPNIEREEKVPKGLLNKFFKNKK